MIINIAILYVHLLLSQASYRGYKLIIMLVSLFVIQISHFLILQEESAIGEPRRDRKKHMHADSDGLLTRSVRPASVDLRSRLHSISTIVFRRQ